MQKKPGATWPAQGIILAISAKGVSTFQKAPPIKVSARKA
jgi:hypothetical protein